MKKWRLLGMAILLALMCVGSANGAPDNPEKLYAEELGVSKETADIWLKALAQEKLGNDDEAIDLYLKCVSGAAKSPMSEFFLRKADDLTSTAVGDCSEKMRAALSKLAQDKNLRPHTVSLAKYLLHLNCKDLGDYKRAEKLIDETGFVRQWLVVGPFDNEGKGGYDAVYPPEEKFDLAGSYDGKLRKVSWRDMGAFPRWGYVDFYEMFRPNENVCAYAAVAVNSATRREVALRLSSDSAFKVFLNGKMLSGRNVYREYNLDIDLDSFGTTLEPGWNLLLVKVTNQEGNWGFLLRMTAPDGTPLSGLEFCADKAKLAKLELVKPGEAPAVAVDNGVEEFLEKLCTEPKTREIALFHALLGEFNMLKVNHDENEHPSRDYLRRAVELDDSAPYWHYLRYHVETDKNIAIESLKKAVQLDPKFARVLYTLSQHYLGTYDYRAKEYNAKALEANPDYFSALLMRLEKMEDGGWGERRTESAGPGWQLWAKQQYKDLAKQFPRSTYLEDKLADYDTKTPAEKMTLLEKKLKKTSGNNAIRRALANMFEDRGDYAKAAQLVHETEMEDPFNTENLKGSALLLFRAGNKKEAFADLDRALAIVPESTDILLLQGSLYVEEGNHEQAITAWKTALDIDNTNTKLEEYVRYLQPAKEATLAMQYKSDLEKIAAEKINPKDYPDASSLWLLNRQVTQMNEDGTSSKLVERVIRVLSQNGVQGYRTVFAGSVSDRSEHRTRCRIKLAKIRKSDGSFRDASYQREGAVANMPDLEIGDTILLQSEVDDIDQPLYKKYFGSQFVFQSASDPVKVSEFTLLYPKERKLNYNAFRFTGKFEQGTAVDGHLRLVWRLTDIPLIKREPNMPAPTEYLPSVSISTFQSWDDTAEWIRGILVDAYEGSPELDACVDKLTAGKNTREEKLLAIYDFVTNGIQYHSFPLAGHGYRPFKARETFERRWGDCKDKAVLLTYMLRKVGIESHFIVARAFSDGAGLMDTTTPAMHIFNHAVVFVPDEPGGKKGVIADGTASLFPYGVIPDMDQNAIMFIVRDKDGILTRGPLETAEQNYEGELAEIRIDANGDADLTLKGVECRGEFGARMRNNFRKGHDRDKRIEDMMRRQFGAIEVRKIDFSPLEDTSKPVTYTYNFKAPSFAKTSNGNLIFPGSLWNSKMTSQYASTSERRLHQVLGLPFGKDSRVRYILPPGYRLKECPKNGSFKNEFGEIEINYQQSAGELKVERKFRRHQQRIEPKDYPAFRKFCQEVDRLEEEKVILEKE